jgi:hypothetical protein
MAVVYRFQTWDITNDCFQTSRRWAAKEAIERVGGQVISEGIEIDDKFLGGEVDGMTARGFDARNPPSGDFQTRVR